MAQIKQKIVEQGSQDSPEFAAIPADERLRLSDARLTPETALERKRIQRRNLSEQPVADKLRVLEELRDRGEMQKGKRRSAARTEPVRFGGRATAQGVSYEVLVASVIAVKMLCGSRTAIWNGVDGAMVTGITMQSSEPVDDIGVSLGEDPDCSVFIAAKERSSSISLTSKNAAFVDTIDAFVRQYLKTPPDHRSKIRLIWAIPSSVGNAAGLELPKALKAFRSEPEDALIVEFLKRRGVREKKALEAVVAAAKKSWLEATDTAATDHELRSLLRSIYVEIYEFGIGRALDVQAESDLRGHVIAEPNQAERAWEKIQAIFMEADRQGGRVTTTSLRKSLSEDGIAPQSPPDFSNDIQKLRDLTAKHLSVLKNHTVLRFGPRPEDAVHIDRSDDLIPLSSAVKRGHLLVTGEPGSGKSGLICELVEGLHKTGAPVVLLLADEIFDGDISETGGFLGLTHSLDQVLANWPGGKSGVLVTDALDAVRDTEIQRRLRRRLEEVKVSGSGWNVIASVRKFDLKFGRELREMFPGEGVDGHASKDFPGIAHFHVGRLSDQQLDTLARLRNEIQPFIERARQNPKASEIHPSPFYLRLAAELLAQGVPPDKLADWNNPAVLFRAFWSNRIEQGEGASQRKAALNAICRRMVDVRRMAVSLKTLSLNSTDNAAVTDLRSRGILQTPTLVHGVLAATDEVRFTHHLLHDYAIARSLIPETEADFYEFAVHEPLLPVFYRQSFLFGLEELWDADSSRQSFWRSALKLEGEVSLHNITRILAPILAARRVESRSDLEPLLAAVQSRPDNDSPAHKALRHLASGVQDAPDATVRAGSDAWCFFVARLGELLPEMGFIQMPLTLLLARLKDICEVTQQVGQQLNAAARSLLADHTDKPVGKGWRYSAFVAIQTICRTFHVAPEASEKSLLLLLRPERLQYFPHHDLHDLADSLKYLGVAGGNIVLRLFEAAFLPGPTGDETEPEGGMIMPLNFQKRDSWHMIRYSLAEFYEHCENGDAGLMTDAACIARNTVVHGDSSESHRTDNIIATITFRDHQCELIADYSHILGRGYEHEENRILAHFEALLRKWAAESDINRLNSALDHFAERNRTSLMWNVFLKVGAEYADSLGTLLESVLVEPVFLTHSDYANAGTELLGALHRMGGKERREHLESLVLELPKSARRYDGENQDSFDTRIQYAQDRALKAFSDANISLESVRELKRRREAVKPLSVNRPPHALSPLNDDDDEVQFRQRHRATGNSHLDSELVRLRDALAPFLNRDNKGINETEADIHWRVIEEAEQAFTRSPDADREVDLWGNLVNACANIAGFIKWPKTDARWRTVRRILLKASTDPRPSADYDREDDSWPSWGVPSPRLDAARSLPFLATRIGEADEDVTAALRRLCQDASYPLRFNLADQLHALYSPAPKLMWELFDTLIRDEKKFSVLEMVARAINRLPRTEMARMKPRLFAIADAAWRRASGDHHIHETLSSIFIFRFLRTGDPDFEKLVDRAIDNSESEKAVRGLQTQLHGCRAGGWMTAGDAVSPDSEADAARERTWTFFAKVLTTAQRKIEQFREERMVLHKEGDTAAEEIDVVQKKIKNEVVLIDSVGSQIYFASGAFKQKDEDEKNLTPAQLKRFWVDAAPLLRDLTLEIHPHVAYHLVQTFEHLLPFAPEEIFLLAAKAIQKSSEAGFQNESLAVPQVVKLIQRVLADHRDIFRKNPDCLTALIKVLDLFVEAGWPEARQLTHRLEEIYR